MKPLLVAFLACCAVPAAAQAPATLGDTAKGVLGSWEFSNAARDKVCTATFKADKTAVGFKVEFDASCPALFPIVSDIAGWTYPDNDFLRLLDAQGRAISEFNEVENGVFEAPTPGTGLLFLQKPAAASAPTQSADVAGDWTMRRGNALLCVFTLSSAPAGDGLALTVKPGCAASVAQLNFTQWRLDNNELVLIPGRGTPWRFEDIDGTTWRRLSEAAEPITLVRQ
jgi:hypothetical protein